MQFGQHSIIIIIKINNNESTKVLNIVYAQISHCFTHAGTYNL